MLISLHLPKTAGSSFAASLQDHFGAKLLTDNHDFPINTPVLMRNTHALKMCILNSVISYKNFECIHGHFLPLKYLLVKDAKFITWMRDPVEGLASHYFFWLRKYDPQNAKPLHKKVVEEKWSLERFCLSPEFKNIYSQFLWGFPIGRFDFIGITEHYQTELEFFAKKFLGTTLPVHSRNINPNNETKSYFEDLELKARVEQYHSKDVSLYKRALDIRLKQRCE